MSTLDPGGDPQSLLDQLAANLERALPGADGLHVERERSLADRMAGRPGRVTIVSVTHGRTALTLRLQGRRLAAETAQAVGGVVISRSQLPVGAWLEALSRAVASIAADISGDAAAAARALGALGVQPAAGALDVQGADLTSGLASLPARVAGRLPAPAEAALRRIVDLLLETLPRVEGQAAQEALLRRTAEDYLPDTLRAYLALPADWAATQRLSDGRTAEESLLQQLAELESAAQQMRDAALRADADALLVNGRFLADRFARSSLDL